MIQAVAKTSKTNRLINYMEELTGSVLESILGKKKRDFTPQAIQDIKALALNRLWPMYTTTHSGKDFLKRIVVEDKIEKDVVRELRAAIDIVRSNPRR